MSKSMNGQHNVRRFVITALAAVTVAGSGLLGTAAAYADGPRVPHPAVPQRIGGFGGGVDDPDFSRPQASEGQSFGPQGPVAATGTWTGWITDDTCGIRTSSVASCAANSASGSAAAQQGPNCVIMANTEGVIMANTEGFCGAGRHR